MDKIEKLKQKYLGKKVYAGSEMNGYDGTITDVVQEEDITTWIWFEVTSDDKTEVDMFDKHELKIKREIITTEYVELD
jgi:hypothetical protein